ncbi:signal-transduction protein [Roseibium sp. TrichSKD4]|uniref:CBS domain-containing protein n=1 Tax=Roseibium sp. TrichSKD4 TaxID=744980 RepID=UPI0001E56907|nr:CBS domain-containing protein [Roseibium sp. TrichSKD4]EFO30598.1 signal-transduction protein [Roseibium sp. TrichSKD4]
MNVASILSTKGHDVITEKSTTLLSDICTTLAEHKIGAIVIADDAGHIEGIISERDIVKAIGTSGPTALEKPVSEVMTKSVVTCTDADSVNAVMAKMSAGRFRHVPVTDDGKVTGVISIGDVVKFKIAQAEMEAEQMRSYISMT